MAKPYVNTSKINASSVVVCPDGEAQAEQVLRDHDAMGRMRADAKRCPNGCVGVEHGTPWEGDRLGVCWEYSITGDPWAVQPYLSLGFSQNPADAVLAATQPEEDTDGK